MKKSTYRWKLRAILKERSREREEWSFTGIVRRGKGECLSRSRVEAVLEVVEEVLIHLVLDGGVQ